MRGVWHTGDCGGGGNWWPLVALVAAAGAVAWFLMWVFHFLIDALTVVGLLSMVGCAVWVRLKWRRWQNTPQQAQPQPVRGRRQAPPVTTPQPQAIPAATVHNHYGHTLQLPEGMTGEDLAKVFRRAEG